MRLAEARAGLFTAYWTKTGSEYGREESDIFQAIQVAAAGEMLIKGLIDKAVFLAGQIYPNNRAVSYVMAGELGDQFPEIKDNQVIADPMAFDTKGEVQKFYSRAAIIKDVRPSRIVGVEPHTFRIGLVNNRVNQWGLPAAEVWGSVAFLLADKELKQKYSGLLGRYFDSPQLAGLVIQERILHQVERARGGPVLDWITENLPSKPAIQVAVQRLVSR